MTTNRPKSSHPPTGELLRQLDGELGDEAVRRLSRHLERCSVCRTRTAALRDRARLASGYLGGLPTGGAVDDIARARVLAAMNIARVGAAARSGSRHRRAWAVAAVFAGLVVISLEVDPLRAWVLDRLPGVAQQEARAPSSALELAPTVVDGKGSLIAFQPVGTTFRLQVEQPQANGELLLQVRSVGRATAQLTGAATETILLLPSGMRIENTSSSRGSYRVTLPVSIDRIVVSIGEGRPRVISPPAGSQPWSTTIQLNEPE